jgi:CHAT domain-containing protein
MQQYSAESVAGIPPDLLIKEKQLLGRLKEYQAKMSLEEKRCEDARPKRLSAWTTEWTKAHLEFDDFLINLKTSYPEYYRLKYQVKEASLKSTQSQLHENEMLISFFEGIDQIYAFYITHNEAHIHVIGATEELKSKIAKLLTIVSSPDIVESMQRKAFIEYASSLYQNLLEPGINEAPLVTSLIIVPDGLLSHLPFSTLLINRVSDDVPYQSLPYLLHSMSISYTQSATVHLETVRSGHDNVAELFVGFAPDYNDQNIAQNSMHSLGALTHNLGEVQSAAVHFPKHQIFTEVSPTMMLESISNAGILHFAMHAVVDEDRPMLSGFVTDIDDTGAYDLLYAYELQSTTLDAKLAVLSACNTGTGLAHRGEGIMSLARSFQYAGCPSVITSLWSVDDLATSEIFSDFYDYIGQGQGKNTALQNAKIHYLSSADPVTAHPFYWAPFTLMGNSQPINIQPSPSWGLLIVGAIGLLIISFLLYSRSNY